MVNDVIVFRIPNFKISAYSLCSHPRPFSQHREKGVSFISQRIIESYLRTATKPLSLDFSSLS